MFDGRDRATAVRLEAKLEAMSVRLEAKSDMALQRMGAIESKQAAHEGICNERQRQFESYVARMAAEQLHSSAEWERFTAESREHRNRIEASVWASNTRLLWKLVGAMFTLLLATSGAIISLSHVGIIK